MVVEISIRMLMDELIIMRATESVGASHGRSSLPLLPRIFKICNIARSNSACGETRVANLRSIAKRQRSL